MEKRRKLKVYTKYPRTPNGFIPNPEIRLTGKWVTNWGFKCGDKITIHNTTSGTIVINLLSKDVPIISL